MIGGSQQLRSFQEGSSRRGWLADLFDFFHPVSRFFVFCWCAWFVFQRNLNVFLFKLLPSVLMLLGSWAPTGSCWIMCNHGRSCKSWPWFCLKVPDFAWKCLMLPESAWFWFPEKGWKCLMPRSWEPRNINLFQWQTAFWKCRKPSPAHPFPENYLFGLFLPFGWFLFCRVIFRDTPKTPIKTSINLTLPRLFLPRKVIVPCKVKG